MAVVAGCGVSSESTTSSKETQQGELEPADDDEGDDGDDAVYDAPLTAADDAVPVIPHGEQMAGATSARAMVDVNLRKSASSSAAVLAVIPSGTIVVLLSTTPSNGFYNVQYSGVSGYGHSSYLTPVSGVSSDPVDIDGPASPANAIARAKAAMGFSYYWGGGAWLASGPTSSSKGSCSGSCPSCTHSGKYGADCSGLVAKAWQFGTKALEVNSHPYSTADFIRDLPGKWSTVSRGSLRAGDALVYRSGGAGHIAIYEKGDGWGSPTVYECRGCSYGCTYSTRSFPAKYHGIRRVGF